MQTVSFQVNGQKLVGSLFYPEKVKTKIQQYFFSMDGKVKGKEVVDMPK
ncbi:MAG: hypothetical protein ACREHC_09040 [Candidatus Levyibacteriota bacterium]